MTDKTKSDLSLDSQIFKESTEGDVEEPEYPDKFYFKELGKLKSVKFDKYLMMLETRNDYRTAKKDNSNELTPIPCFIAFLVLELRSKFEEELKTNRCFLETKKFPDKDIIDDLAKQIYFKCRDYDEVVTVTSEADATLLFFVLLNYMQHLEQHLIQGSRETMQFIREQPIFKFIRPRDFVILNQIHNFITYCFVNTGASSGGKSKDTTNLKSLDALIQKYYMEFGTKRLDDIHKRNKLHQLFYRDLRSLRSTTHRYLMRFILRNCLYFVRRYVYHANSKLRKLRMESSKESNLTSIPFITCFAVHRMAQFLAIACTEILDLKNELEDRITFLVNILSIHMENIWFRQKLISTIVVSTEQEHCHENCPCGI